MKHLFLALFVCLASPLFSQVLDSMALKREVDSLQILNQKLIGERRLPEALEVIETAGQKILAAYGEMNAPYARCMFNLARTYGFMGNSVEAERYYLKTKYLRENVLGTEHPDYLKTIINLANLYMYLGDYLKAEPIYLDARDIFINIHATDKPDYAGCLNNLGSLYRVMGKYEKAEPLLQENIEIRAKMLGKSHPDYASSLTNLAILYTQMGQYSEAEPLFLEAIDIRAKKGGKETAEYANSLNSLGILYVMTGYYTKAEPIYLESLAIREKTLGKEHPHYAASLNNLAKLYTKTGQYTQAEALYLQSKDIEERTMGKEYQGYASTLANLASLYQDMQQFAQAEPLYLESKEILQKILGKEHPDYITVSTGLAFFYWQTKQEKLAASLLSENAKTQRSFLINATQHLSERELFDYNKTFSKDLDLYFSCAQTGGIASKEIASLCFDNTLFYNGFLLTAVNQMKQVASSDTSTANKFDARANLRRRIAREYAKPIAGRDALQIAAWEEKANQLEKEMVRSVAGYGNLVRQVSWKEVQQQLAPDAAVIEFVSYRYYNLLPTDSILYAALVLLPNDTAPKFVPLFEESQLLPLLDPPGSFNELIIKDLYGIKPDLRRLFWQPLEPFLQGIKTVYYAPSGLLHRINPAALLNESKESISKNRQWVRLGSTRELVTGHLADQSFAQSTPSTAGSPPAAFIFGGITYDMDSLAFATANRSATENPGRNGSFSQIVREQPTLKTRGIRGNPDGTWETLTATGIEADQVGSILRKAGFSTTVQKGYTASEERFKTIGTANPSPRILHLATHGFSYPDPKKDPPKGFADTEPTYKLHDDPMLRSGLLLAGANFYWKNKRPLAQREDGVLVAYEVRDMNLRNTELAVLSACQTGLGDVVGSEGVYGLQRAFRIAGAKFLIVSLWEVPDEQTQALMQVFYQNWATKKENLRDAFTHAQQVLRKKDPNPYLWAGFVLIE